LDENGKKELSKGTVNKSSLR